MLGGSGLPFPTPQALYPSLPAGQAVQFSSNILQVPGGLAVLVPAGWWMFSGSRYSMVQYKDPVTNLWQPYGTWIGNGPTFVNSDGNSVRIFNPTGCPIGALVTNVGSSYVQATTTVTAGAGGSTWLGIVGGAISQTVTIGAVGGVTGGANFTIPPILVASPPPAGGVPATATCTISAGAVNAVTVVDQGAGYSAPPTWQVIPNPFDPNIGIITIPPLTSTVVGAGQISAILPTYFGTVQTSVPSLTVAGAGSSAAATAIMCFAITGVSFSNSGGAGYTNTNVLVATLGGQVTTAAGAILNPSIGPALLIPRPANISAPVSGNAIGTAVITDGGLFQLAPNGVVLSADQVGGTEISTISVPTFTLGAATDRIFFQNAGSLF